MIKKISLRINFVYENIKVPLFILYFITFECFKINKSINKALRDVKDLCSQRNEINSTKNTINKIYQILHNKIRITIHKNLEIILIKEFLS